jgi:phenylacetic acid degradation protein
MPARIVRALTPDEIAWKRQGTREYQALARRCRTELLPCEPLREPEPDRPRPPALTGIRPLFETRRD